MIEPTDEMLNAWRDAMKAAAAEAVRAGEPLGRSQDVARAGLAAVLAIVERDLSAGWLIWSNEHQMWWKADRAGYTADMMCAGRYTLEAALAETRTRKTATGLPGEVAVRAPHISLIGNRDLAGMMRAATAEATRQAMAS